MTKHGTFTSGISAAFSHVAQLISPGLKLAKLHGKASFFSGKAK